MPTMTPRSLPDGLVLKSGSHDPNGTFCVMEAVAYVAGEPWSDSPACACPVIAAFLRSWNDGIRDDARRTELLAPFIPRLVGTKSSAAVELKRSYLAFDWLVRVQVPTWLDLTPALQSHAEALRALSPLIDKAAVEASQKPLDAAGDAAGDAAWDAAWAAVRAAAGDAAWAAARDAAGAAARAAARDALAPTVKQLEQSALDLIERMLATR